jgi:hypothetical protein
MRGGITFCLVLVQIEHIPDFIFPLLVLLLGVKKCWLCLSDKNSICQTFLHYRNCVHHCCHNYSTLPYLPLHHICNIQYSVPYVTHIHGIEFTVQINNLNSVCWNRVGENINKSIKRIFQSLALILHLSKVSREVS